MKFAERIKQVVPIPPAEQAALNVIITNHWLLGQLSEVMDPHGITPPQYNVLRILRGCHPGYASVSDIRDRLLERTPDTTRLLNRLHRKRLIRRQRNREDQRVVEVRISKWGLNLLEAMQADVDGLFSVLEGQLSEGQFLSLSTMLDALREGLE